MQVFFDEVGCKGGFGGLTADQQVKGGHSADMGLMGTLPRSWAACNAHYSLMSKQESELPRVSVQVVVSRLPSPSPEVGVGRLTMHTVRAKLDRTQGSRRLRGGKAGRS